ncbi:potassium transporter TrkH [Idiomarina tyrosinivorans]|uniref:Trk system potassium uptake protein n=1 Tax=Idiomarina tyrosinivorans TaxID=1445662 RepID=A0A432ZRE7_9GAMM|nr:TrkH family potassium uptake protein [Idiomarina tyrosinivorans]RUO80484.1 potassium transporter TrkH [Idiomarina tyrosinivorans]
MAEQHRHPNIQDESLHVPFSQSNSVRLLAKAVGGLIAIFAIALLAPFVLAVVNAEKDQWHYLTLSVIGIVVGVALFLQPTRGASLRARQVFLLTTVCWLCAGIFGALPLYIAGPKLGFVDALFESISAITTTGSTTIVGLDKLPSSALLWRAMLQWLGGVGIIVMAMAILPFLQVGGMRLFQAESSDISGKFLPRSNHMVMAIARVYLLLTIVAATVYWILGMGGFDAVVHAMTSVATGGFSNYDSSFGFFNDQPALVVAATLMMFLGALPFVLYIRVLKGDTEPLLHDPQVRAFTIFLVIVITALALLQAWNGRDTLDAFIHTGFNVVSVVTTTGYATEDYSQWGGWAIMAFFYLTFVGGCTGSTAGGIKIFRFQLSQLLLKKQFAQLIHPNLTRVQTYQDKRVNDTLLGSMVAFCFMYFLLVGALAFGLSFFDMDFISAISGAATAVSNVGPGLGDVIGPAGNFVTIEPGAKILLIIGMLAGRLEIMTVLILFHRQYWRH